MFPVTPGAFDTVAYPNGPPSYATEVFVYTIDKELGELVYATYLGGASTDAVEDVRINSNGEVVLFGWAGQAGGPGSATSFPTTSSAFQPNHGGLIDVYVGSPHAYRRRAQIFYIPRREQG